MVVTDDPHSKMYKKFSMQWEAAFNDGKFDDALAIGIKSYSTFRDKGNKQWSNASLNLIAVTIPSLITEKDPRDMPKGARACSFCGTSYAEPKEHLIAGPDVLICGKCVDLCAGIFKEKKAELKE